MSERRLLATDGVASNMKDLVSSPEQMQDIIRSVLFDEPRVGIPAKLPKPEELVAEPDGKVSFDLRVDSPRYSVRGVVGRMSRLQFKGMVWETLRHQGVVLGRTLGGAWKPVAAKLTYGTRTVTEAQPTGVAPSAIGNLTLEKGEVKDGPQRLRHVPVEQRDIVLHVAWAELTQSPIICPTFEEFQRRVGVRFGFADSGGLVKRMGTVDRQLRDHAKDVIAWTYQMGDGVVSDLSPELHEKARKFLMDYGMPITEVAGALKLSEERVRSLYAELQSQAPVEEKPAPKRRRKKAVTDASA